MIQKWKKLLQLLETLKMDKKKIIVSVIIVIFMIVGLYLTFVGDFSKITSKFSLKKGDSNDYVKNLQITLNNKGENLTVDGSFGQKTEDALFRLTGKREIKSLNDFEEIIK